MLFRPKENVPIHISKLQNLIGSLTIVAGILLGVLLNTNDAYIYLDKLNWSNLIGYIVISIIFFISAYGIRRVRKWAFYLTLAINSINLIGLLSGYISYVAVLSIVSLYLLYKHRKMFLGKEEV